MHAAVKTAARTTFVIAETARTAINRSGDTAKLKHQKELLEHRERVLEMLREAQMLHAAYDDEFDQAMRERLEHVKENRSKQKHYIHNHVGMQDFVVSRMSTKVTGFMPEHLRPIVAEKILKLQEHLKEIDRTIEAVGQELENNRHVYAERVFERLTKGVPIANEEEEVGDIDNRLDY